MLGVVFLSGCAGISINPITNQDETERNFNGYVVYSPKVFVHVKVVDNDCKISTFQMPDYAKPFTVNINGGFGKINANVNIINGWMLGGIIADIDNTSVVGDINGAAFPQSLQQNDPDKRKKPDVCGDMKEGIYSLEYANTSLKDVNTATIKLKKVTIVNK